MLRGAIARHNFKRGVVAPQRDFLGAVVSVMDLGRACNSGVFANDPNGFTKGNAGLSAVNGGEDRFTTRNALRADRVQRVANREIPVQLDSSGGLPRRKR